jgi:hypothetical protein
MPLQPQTETSSSPERYSFILILALQYGQAKRGHSIYRPWPLFRQGELNRFSENQQRSTMLMLYNA